MIFQTFFFCDQSTDDSTQQLSPKGASWKTKNSLEYHLRLRGPICPDDQFIRVRCSQFPGTHYAKGKVIATFVSWKNGQFSSLIIVWEQRSNEYSTTDGPTMHSRRGPKKTIRSLPTKFMQITFFTETFASKDRVKIWWWCWSWTLLRRRAHWKNAPTNISRNKVAEFFVLPNSRLMSSLPPFVLCVWTGSGGTKYWNRFFSGRSATNFIRHKSSSLRRPNRPRLHNPFPFAYSVV